MLGGQSLRPSRSKPHEHLSALLRQELPGRHECGLSESVRSSIHHNTQGHNRLQEQPPLETLFISGSVSDLFQVVSTASTSIRAAGRQHSAQRDRKRAQRQQLACVLKGAELYSPSHHLRPAQQCLINEPSSNRASFILRHHEAIEADRSSAATRKTHNVQRTGNHLHALSTTRVTRTELESEGCILGSCSHN